MLMPLRLFLLSRLTPHTAIAKFSRFIFHNNLKPKGNHTKPRGIISSACLLSTYENCKRQRGKATEVPSLNWVLHTQVLLFLFHKTYIDVHCFKSLWNSSECSLSAQQNCDPLKSIKVAHKVLGVNKLQECHDACVVKVITSMPPNSNQCVN